MNEWKTDTITNTCPIKLRGHKLEKKLELVRIEQELVEVLLSEAKGDSALERYLRDRHTKLETEELNLSKDQRRIDTRRGRKEKAIEVSAHLIVLLDGLYPHAHQTLGEPMVHRPPMRDLESNLSHIKMWCEKEGVV